jgi:hypothetical protein
MSLAIFEIRRTEVFVQLFLRLHVIFLKLIGQLFQGFEVLDGDSHFLDFLEIAVILFSKKTLSSR